MQGKLVKYDANGGIVRYGVVAEVRGGTQLWAHWRNTAEEARAAYEEYKQGVVNGLTWIGSKSSSIKIIEGEDMSTKQYKVGDKIDLTNALIPLSDESHTQYKEGDLFVIVDAGLAGIDSKYKGNVISLSEQDRSSCPYFKIDSVTVRSCLNWRGLAPIPVGKALKAQKPVVVLTRTEYSDGVIVGDDDLSFDGKTFKREELKKLVSRYQEVLRRPVGTVVLPKTTKKAKK